MGKEELCIPGLVFWMNMPSHHQSHFFSTLWESGLDVQILYYGNLTAERLAQGWENSLTCRPNEHFVSNDLTALELVPDWKERIHVVPGYGSGFLRRLVGLLSKKGIPWIHWSEAAHPGLRWFVSWPIKMLHGRRVNRYALGAFAVSKSAAIDFRRWTIKRDKIRLLPYSISAPAFDRADDVIARFRDDADVCFMFIGEISRRKGIDVLIRAFVELGDDKQKACLVLVGNDGMQGLLQTEAQRLGITDRVFFRGVIPASKIGTAFAAANVIVLPSRFDGWGMVLSEGLMLGKALIASSGCGAADHLIQRGRNGYVVAPGDSSALAAAMREYIRDPGLAEQHGRESAAISGQFHPKATARRFVRYLQELSGNRISLIQTSEAR